MVHCNLFEPISFLRSKKFVKNLGSGLHISQKAAYAKELSRYIHLNPVRAQIVQSPEEYNWSSYSFHTGRTSCPNWLSRNFVLGYFGDKLPTAQKGYKNFVSKLVNQEYDSHLEKVTGSVLLGSQDFIEMVKDRLLASQKPSKDLPVVGQLTRRATMPEVFDAVESVIPEEPALARSPAIYLSRKYTGEKLRTIGEHFGIEDSAVSQACKRFMLRVQRDGGLRKRLEQIEKKLTL
jgi:hypothetical protein